MALNTDVQVPIHSKQAEKLQASLLLFLLRLDTNTRNTDSFLTNHKIALDGKQHI